MALTEFWEVNPGNETEVWQKLIGHDFELEGETESQAEVICDGIPAHGRALEIGAGVGRLMKSIRSMQWFDEVWGCDSSVSLVVAGAGYLADATHLSLCDGLSLPYPDQTFDFVYSFTVFQHMRSLAMIYRNLCEARRVLVPNGLCRIQTVKAKEGASPNDFSVYDGRVMWDEQEFMDLFREAGLEIVKVEVGLTHPEHIWVTARRPS